MSRTIGFTIGALFDSAGRLRRDPALNAAHLIRIADVIVAYDVTRQYEVVLWGSARLEARGGRKPFVLVVELDFDQPEFDQLRDVVRALKGPLEFVPLE